MCIYIFVIVIVLLDGCRTEENLEMLISLCCVIINIHSCDVRQYDLCSAFTVTIQGWFFTLPRKHVQIVKFKLKDWKPTTYNYLWATGSIKVHQQRKHHLKLPCSRICCSLHIRVLKHMSHCLILERLHFQSRPNLFTTHISSCISACVRVRL